MPHTSTDTALQNAAALMKHLGEEEALAVMATLSAEGAVKLKAAMARARVALPLRSEEIAVKFTPVTASQSQLSSDAGHYVRSLLKQALGEDDLAALPMQDRQNTVEKHADVSGIDQLKAVDAPAIAELLTSEHPQIIAAILVQLDTRVAARVLNNLPQRLCHQVVPRIATLQSVHGAALQDLDEGLRSALFSRGQAIGNPLRGGVTPVAEMLMYLGANLKGSLLDSIARQDPDMAQKLVQKMADSKPAPA